MRSGEIDTAPIWDDVTTLRGEMLPQIDIISGGFPCQDLSIANTNGKGLEGKRSGLFFEVVRLIKECKPKFVFLENVPAIRTRGGEIVVKELASLGYDCRWTTLSASAVGAPHKRDRWFLVAHSKCARLGEGPDEFGDGPEWRSPDQLGDADSSSGTMANPISEGLQGGLSVRENEEREGKHGHLGCSSSGSSSGRTTESRTNLTKDFWAVEPAVGRASDGLSSWLDKADTCCKKMAEGIICYASETETRPEEVLRILLEGANEEKIRQAFRGHGIVSSQEVLQSLLFRIKERWFNEPRIQLESEKKSETELRGLWSNETSSCSSYRSKQKKQSSNKHPNSLQTLSQFLALNAEEAWSEYRWKNGQIIFWDNNWENGISRVTNGLSDRAHRIRCLGNSVVPLQVQTAFKKLLNLE
jgi:DNA (cytosine-5)-methyltransferase 1